MQSKKGNGVKVIRKKQRKWVASVCIISLFVLMLFVVGQNAFESNVSNSDRFYSGTRINGVNVSDMTKHDAANMILAKLSEKRDGIKMTFKHGDKEWVFLGKDFEVNTDILPLVESAFNYGREGSSITKLSTIRRIKENGFDTCISYRNLLSGLNQKIDDMINEINIEPTEPVVTFKPDSKAMFSVKEGVSGQAVDKEKLYELIDNAFLKSPQISINIETSEVMPIHTKAEIEANLKQRSKFSTSYKTSIYERKSNIKLALSKFNGMEILPQQEVSFNQTTGPRDSANGYKKANVILNGVFVEGSGGGVCQASTTLYNALLNADIEIVEANKHSLPVSYVPLAFDAMVSEGYSDLKFKNNTEYPIYIKAYGDNENAYVEIYGKPFDSGVTIQHRAEFIKVLPHKGDRIVKDDNGEYEDKIMFKGEYYRVKKPREGYQAKAYLDFYENGQLVESRLVRDETYNPQEGIVIEGVHDLPEGMTLPENTVTLVPAQTEATANEETAKRKIAETNPEKYNP